MKAFFQEVLAAIKEGPALFFAPVAGAVRAAKQGAPARQDSPASSIHRNLK